ncbi:hypothetical protein THAOC_23835, partial [Thalassiosira oceanica]
VGFLVQRDGDLEVLARPAVVRAADAHYPAAGEDLELLAGTDVGRHGDSEVGQGSAKERHDFLPYCGKNYLDRTRPVCSGAAGGGAAGAAWSWSGAPLFLITFEPGCPPYSHKERGVCTPTEESEVEKTRRPASCPALSPTKHVQRGCCRSGRCRVSRPGRAESPGAVDGKWPRQAGGGPVPNLLRPNRTARGPTFKVACLLHEEGVRRLRIDGTSARNVR